MKKQAIWKDTVLAESDDLVQVEGNYYFPPTSLRPEYFLPSDHHTVCPWKGKASYYTVRVDNQDNQDAAWYYPDPKPAAQHISGRVAFWRGVRIQDAE